MVNRTKTRFAQQSIFPRPPAVRSKRGVDTSAGLAIVANAAIATGPAVLCFKFVLYYMQG